MIYYAQVYVPGQTHFNDEGIIVGYDIYFSNENTDYSYTWMPWNGSDAICKDNYIKKLFTITDWYNPAIQDMDLTPAFVIDQSANSLFSGCLNTTIPDMDKIRISGGEGFISMFRGCPNLVSVDCSNWWTSDAKAIDYMFEGCSSLEEINIEGWDVSNIWACSYCFANCPKLSSIKVTSGTDWSVQMDIGGWETRLDGIFENSPLLPDFHAEHIGIGAANDRLSQSGEDWYQYGGYFRHDWSFINYDVYEKVNDTWVKANLKEKEYTQWKDTTPMVKEY